MLCRQHGSKRALSFRLLQNPSSNPSLHPSETIGSLFTVDILEKCHLIGKSQRLEVSAEEPAPMETPAVVVQLVGGLRKHP